MATTEARRSPASFFRRDANAPRDGRPLFVQLPRLWKAMIITSFVINLFLIALLIGAGYFYWRWKSEIASTTVGVQGFAHDNVAELRDVVQQLQAAHIKTTIPLDQPLPVHLNVPIDTTTTVTTTAPVPLNVPADIDMGPFGQLHPNVSLNLPPGTSLNIALKLNVPLDTTIPVKLSVPVDIPMKETALAPQFQRLGAVLNRLLSSLGPAIGVPIPEDVPPIQPPEKSQ